MPIKNEIFRYDHAFVLSELAKSSGATPDLLLDGNRVVQATIKLDTIGTITFKDSLNFIPMALSQMPAAFGFTGLAKGTFPYMFNHPEHYHTVRQGLPEKEYYQPEYMTPAGKEKFERWWDEHKDDEFDFDVEILKYCMDDVKILVMAVKSYLKVGGQRKRRSCCANIMSQFQICHDIFNGWNPIVQTCTLAGFVMFVMKHEHFTPGVVGYIPENGFPGRNNSTLALKYLQYLESQDPNLRMQHALRGGERRLACGQFNYYADGFCETTNTVYEASFLQFCGHKPPLLFLTGLWLHVPWMQTVLH